MENVVLFKILPYLVYIASFLMAIGSGVLVYTGLSNPTERVQTRLRMRSTIAKGKSSIQASASKSVAEDWLKKAGNPLGITSFSYHAVFISLVGLLLINYVLFPFIVDGDFNLIGFGVIVMGFIFLLPAMPFSLFTFIMKRLVEYRQAKKNAEVFMLYDLLINELEMMKMSRINSYNLIKELLPYFSTIQLLLAKTLSEWSSSVGPEVALDNLAEGLNTKESKSLVSVLKSLDKVDRETAIKSLKGMQSMFSRAQIENNRRKRKVTTDLFGLPVKVTHFLIILNFVVVVVTMVSVVLNANR